MVLSSPLKIPAAEPLPNRKPKNIKNENDRLIKTIPIKLKNKLNNINFLISTFPANIPLLIKANRNPKVPAGATNPKKLFETPKVPCILVNNGPLICIIEAPKPTYKNIMRVHLIFKFFNFFFIYISFFFYGDVINYMDPIQKLVS